MRSRAALPRWLALTVTSCVLLACTGRPAPVTDPPAASTTGPAPGATVVGAVDYATMKDQLQQRLAGGDPSLNAVRAVLVSVDDHTVLSLYRDFGPTDHAHVWSVTKSVLSILVGIAIDEGRLRLDQTLGELLPDHLDEMTPEVRSISVRQLLTMTSGLQGGLSSVDTTVKDPVRGMLRDPLVAEPGATYVYSNVSAHLLGAVLRQAVDRPLLDFAREVLFDPLGIDTRPAWQGFQIETGLRQPGFGWGTDRDGTNSGCCLLKLTAPDLVKIGQLYLNGGRWQGRQVVSSAWVRDSTRNQLTAAQTGAEGPYGYLWWVGDHESHASFAARGSFGQQIVVVPDHRLVVATIADESGLDNPTDEFVTTFQDVVLQPILRT